MTQMSSAGGIAEIGQGFQLPLPVVKETPRFPDSAHLSHGEMLIVYGVINLEGKLEQLEVKQSPDATLNNSVLETLQKWLFQAGSLDGKDVVTRVLIGIPVWIED